MPRFIPVVLFPVSLFVVLILPEAQSDILSLKALKFDHSDFSHIAFQPDMRSMTEKFSVCLWIRQPDPDNNSPFSYGTHTYEIFMTDNGRFHRLFGSESLDSALTSKFTEVLGTWYFYCSTWSLRTRTFKIYLNGQLIGSETTPPERRLKTGLTMVVGARTEDGRSNSFRGEIFNLNFFSRELSATHVAEMSAAGLCSVMSWTPRNYRAIKWEQILAMSRTGTITEVELDRGCDLAALQLVLTKAIENEAAKTGEKLDAAITENRSLINGHEASLNKILSELAKVHEKFSSTQDELVKVQGLFNSTQEELVNVQGLFNSSQEELEGVKRRLATSEGQLNEKRLALEESKLESKNVSESGWALVKGKLTKWDVFYSCPFYNKRFTRRSYWKLRTTWDDFKSGLLGVNMSDSTIDLLKRLDEKENCDDL